MSPHALSPLVTPEVTPSQRRCRNTTADDVRNVDLIKRDNQPRQTSLSTTPGGPYILQLWLSIGSFSAIILSNLCWCNGILLYRYNVQISCLSLENSVCGAPVERFASTFNTVRTSSNIYAYKRSKKGSYRCQHMQFLLYTL